MNLPANYPFQGTSEASATRTTIVHRSYDVELCDVECWREGDEYVMRGVGFDLYAVAGGADEALRKFVEEVDSLVGSLWRLGEGATEEERTLLGRLATPLFEVRKRAQERDSRRLVLFPRFRSEHSPAREWGSSSSHAKLNHPSIA